MYMCIMIDVRDTIIMHNIIIIITCVCCPQDYYDDEDVPEQFGESSQRTGTPVSDDGKESKTLSYTD